MLDKILPQLPHGQRLIEPFAGSAAVAINAGYEQAIVSDLNPHLIELYEMVRDRLSDFIEEGQKLFSGANDRESFDNLRSEFNSTSDAFRRAAIFVYFTDTDLTDFVVTIHLENSMSLLVDIKGQLFLNAK